MEVELAVYLDVDFYEIEEWKKAVEVAHESNRSLYTWKTSGRANWVERGMSNVDALGLVLLPAGMPEYLEMANDPEDDVL